MVRMTIQNFHHRAINKKTAVTTPDIWEMTLLMERVMGIEPTRPAWKAGILPLNYTRRYPL